MIWDKYVCVNVHVPTSENAQVQVQMYIIFLTFHTLTNTHTDSEEIHFKLGASEQALTVMILHVDFDYVLWWIWGIPHKIRDQNFFFHLIFFFRFSTQKYSIPIFLCQYYMWNFREMIFWSSAFTKKSLFSTAYTEKSNEDTKIRPRHETCVFSSPFN